MQLSERAARYSHSTLDAQDSSTDIQGCRRIDSSEGRSHGRMDKH